MTPSPLRLATVAWFALACPFGAAAAPAPEAGRILADLKVLSSDAFEGRGPSTPGERRTVEYLTRRFKAAGLSPGGDPLKSGGRAWTQDVPLARFSLKGPVSISVTAGGRADAWTQGEQIAIRAPQTGIDHLTVRDAPVVFVGYGVNAPERDWDDFKGLDLKGKIALVLVNDPDFETGAGDFGGKAMTYYGRWSYKYEEAARRGALGMLVIHETAPAAYGWATVRSSNAVDIFDVIRARPADVHPPLEGWIQRDVAAGLLKSAGLDFEALKVEARERSFRPVELAGIRFSADFAVQAEKVVSKNVVAVLPGRRFPNERLIYSAHWDHFGVGEPDAGGDRIYNGAVDNATGTAMLLDIARAFAAGPRPHRTLVFLALTAEERGLLGSEYYASAPLYPLATTVAVLNMDAFRPDGLSRDFSTAGDAPLTLQDDLVAVARTRGLAFTPDPLPQAGRFFRSDHFSFAKRGVPALSTGSGEDMIQGGQPAGRAWRDDFTAKAYHQPSDQFDPAWTGDNLARRRGSGLRSWPQAGRQPNLARMEGRGRVQGRTGPDRRPARQGALNAAITKGDGMGATSKLLALVTALFAAAPARAAEQEQVRQADYVIRDFRFASGEVLAELKLHYTTLGAPTGQPVLVLHGTGGSGEGLLTPAFAGQLFGPGQPLDAATHYIILPDAIGSGASSKPSDGLRMKFPRYTYGDIVESQRRLIQDHLHIPHLRLVMGVSMGGMLTWMWGEAQPGFMDALIPLSSQPVQVAGRNWMFRRMAVDVIRADPAWKGGDYTVQPRSLALAMTYFGLLSSGGEQALYAAAPTWAAADRMATERLRGGAGGDANDTIYQFEAARDYDPAPKLETIQARVLAINSADDERNPPQLGVMAPALARLKNGRLHLIPASARTRGHGTVGDASLWAHLLPDFLAGK